MALTTFLKILKATQTLHDKGQVLLLKNDQDISNSWVITNIAVLLETVVGSIFAPRDFPQHIAPGSTGIVPKPRICEAFPDLNIDMIIGFLEHFEFCHRVEPDWLGEIQSMSDDEYYLFPALLTSENMPHVMQESLLLWLVDVFYSRRSVLHHSVPSCPPPSTCLPVCTTPG